MRVSSKGRYGLAAMVYIAGFWDKDEPVTIISISEKLGISKIYLEQVFALLKRAKLVTSIKGAQGGYKIIDDPKKISVFDILLATEATFFEKTETAVLDNAEGLDTAINSSVWEGLDGIIKEYLSGITLFELNEKAQSEKNKNSIMFYI